MAQGKGNKAKGRRTSKHKAYHEAQFYRTTANKARRAKNRLRKRNQWLSNVAERAARGHPVPKSFTVR